MKKQGGTIYIKKKKIRETIKISCLQIKQRQQQQQLPE